MKLEAKTGCVRLFLLLKILTFLAESRVEWVFMKNSNFFWRKMVWLDNKQQFLFELKSAEFESIVEDPY